jgi:glycosyltransferase involved in cell wall biosynthesis
MAESCQLELVRAPSRSRVQALLATLRSSEPWTALRHARPVLAARVADLLGRGSFDVVHAEQPHALAACAPAFERGVPVVLRAHNVETDLWTSAAREPGLRGLLARREARRVERWEGAMVRRAAATVALTDEDARRLRALGGPDARVHHVSAPFPASLEAGADSLPGEPAVVVAGSAGWLPNERGLRWFASDVWPLVAKALPGARLHVFGGEGALPADATRHPSPADSRAVFAPGSVHAVPLLFASGVRMRILEAWARGVPVVATSAGAAGLGAASGRELLVADTPAAWADAIGRAVVESATLVTAGRARLASHHDPRTVAEALNAIYDIHRRGPLDLGGAAPRPPDPPLAPRE